MRRLFALIGSLGLLGFLACSQVNVVGPEPNGLLVVGTGKVRATPDMATVSVGVQTFAPDAQQAVAENNDKVAAILDAMQALGIPDEDVQTERISIQPQMFFPRDEPPRVVGFQVTNSVRIVVRELELVGTALQRAVDAGANLVHGITFDIAEREQLLAEARRMAVQDAQRQADEIASTAGITLGDPIRIQESQQAPPVPLVRMEAVGEAATVPVQPGTMEITVTVEILYAIE